jgi:hypothetical protein
MMTMTSGGGGGSVKAVLTNLWLTADQLQPTYVRCPEGKPSWLPDCLIKNRNVAEYLAASITGRTRDCELGVESSVLLDLRLDNVLAKLMDYIHLAQQMANAGNFTKAR